MSEESAIDDTELGDIDDAFEAVGIEAHDDARDDDAGGDEDYAEDGDGAEGGEESAGKHRKIPTWTETIGCIITANMEARARNPQQSYRGRGGHGGHGGPRNR